MEHLLVATIDVALAAQNAAVAAESLGYGIVYIGGIRNDPFTAASLLALPPKTFPVFGMCIGLPAQDAATLARPRLPLSGFVHHNQYEISQVGQAIETYDEMMKQYMIARTGGAQVKTWSEDVETKMKANARRHMKSLLHQQGFELAE
jgi:FMN reductase (NADPH)